MIPIQLLWAISLSFCKISILLLYTRIFTMRFMVIVAWATAALITCFALSTILSCLLICRPLALNWDPTLEGTCGDQLLSYTITGSFNLATDVIVLILPLPYLWKLQMKLYKKIILSCTFSLGIWSVIVDDPPTLMDWDSLANVWPLRTAPSSSPACASPPSHTSTTLISHTASPKHSSCHRSNPAWVSPSLASRFYARFSVDPNTPRTEPPATKYLTRHQAAVALSGAGMRYERRTASRCSRTTRLRTSYGRWVARTMLLSPLHGWTAVRGAVMPRTGMSEGPVGQQLTRASP